MAQVDSVSPPGSDETPSAPIADEQAPPPKAVPKPLVIVAIVFLFGFAAHQGRALWWEWQQLTDDMTLVRRTAVIGYQNIHPNPTFARRPRDWFHDEGQSTLLWSGWDGSGHRWFKIGRGEVQRERVSYPMGRDVVQAIDYPVVENGGGTIWGRIPNEAPVVGFELGGIMTVYPMQVLEKVLVINDQVQDRPYLVLLNSLGGADRMVRIYEPIVEGHRVTLGTSGYFHDQKPMLYDRGTESLWVQTAEGDLAAIAGHFKGVRLKQLAQKTPVTWADWRWQYPRSRLLVGADRTRIAPEL